MLYIVYGLAFFVLTLFIKFGIYKHYKNTGKKLDIWRGYTCVGTICILGIVSGNTYYFAAIIGFVTGEYLAKEQGWH